MNNYLPPWHIYTYFEGMPSITYELQAPEIYYS